jgi:hypothetical protein
VAITAVQAQAIKRQQSTDAAATVPT